MGSCFFIGHRETPDQVYPTLLETIERHITEYGVTEFVVGQYGNFDRLVIRALSQAKRAHPDITLMLMTPYYPVNRKVDLPKAFDALFYPPNLVGSEMCIRDRIHITNLAEEQIPLPKKTDDVI